MNIAIQRKTLRRSTQVVCDSIQELEATREVVKIFRDFEADKLNISPKKILMLWKGKHEIKLRTDLDLRGNSDAFIKEGMNDLRSMLKPMFPAIPNHLEAEVREVLSTEISVSESNGYDSALAALTELRDKLSNIHRALDLQALEVGNFLQSGLHFIAHDFYASKEFRVIIKHGKRHQLTSERARIVEVLCKARQSKQLDVPVEKLLASAFGRSHGYEKNLCKAFKDNGREAFADLIQITGSNTARTARLKIE